MIIIIIGLIIITNSQIHNLTYYSTVIYLVYDSYTARKRGLQTSDINTA